MLRGSLSRRAHRERGRRRRRRAQADPAAVGGGPACPRAGEAGSSEALTTRISQARPPRSGAAPRRLLAGVDVHHLAQELDRLFARALEGVAAHDRPERSAVAEAADLGEDLVRPLGLAAGEDHHPLAVEAALHDVTRAVRERLPGDVVLLEDLLRLGLVDEVARRL